MILYDGTVKRYQSTKSTRILRKLKATNFQKGLLRMTYGYRKTVNGKIEEFYNDTVLLPKKKL